MINGLHQYTTRALIEELKLRKDITPEQGNDLLDLVIDYAEFEEIDLDQLSIFDDE